MDQIEEITGVIGLIIDSMILLPLMLGAAMVLLVVGKIVHTLVSRPDAVDRPNFFTSTPEGNCVRAEIMDADATNRYR